MAHLHKVYDSDTHFKIDATSRIVINESDIKKIMLIQNDHNSERFTFELPRYIEEHDMTLCDVVEIHYINTDSKTKESMKDVYIVDDLQVYPDDENVVVLSWLLSRNATKYVGNLSFLICFKCLDGTEIEYMWSTAIYSKITVGTSIYNSEQVVEIYSDVLEQWRDSLLNVAYDAAALVDQSVDKYMTENPVVVDIQATDESIQYSMDGEEWKDIIPIADLKGEKGDTGEQGIQGESGIDGISPTVTVEQLDNAAKIVATDANGTTEAIISGGSAGDAGKSAYETAQEGGYSGTEEEFATSLAGIDGHMSKTDPVGTGSFSMNRMAGSTVGPHSSTVGFNNTASSNNSHAEGMMTTAGGDASHAEGMNSKANGSHSHAEGMMTTAEGNGSHAEGSSTKAIGMYSHTEGMLTTASVDGSHAEGTSTKANGRYSHAEGMNATTGGDASHAEGMNSKANGKYSHAEGMGTTADGESSHAEGMNTTAKGDYQHVQGKFNIEDTENTYAHIVGNGNGTTRSNAHTLDWDGNAWFAGDVKATDSEGNEVSLVDLASNAGGSGEYLTIENPTGTGSFSMNRAANTTVGENSSVLGENCKATGTASHAEGYGCQATDDYAHAEGRNTHAEMSQAHAEGYETYSRGLCSHAEGCETQANSHYTHAEGLKTNAGKAASHAEGVSTTTWGDAAHAEGHSTYAENKASHAEGIGTMAIQEAQHAQGKYNIADYENKYAHIVGNGQSGDAPSNAHTLDWNGNAWFAGDVTATDKNGNSVSLVDLAGLPEQTIIAINDAAMSKTATGTIIELTDSAELPFAKFKVFGSSYQEGIASSAHRSDIDSTSDGGDINIMLYAGVTDDEGNFPEIANTLIIAVTEGLRGIPVESGGNHTDLNGQQWICDEIDLTRGVYIQRVYKHIFDGTETVSPLDTVSETNVARCVITLPHRSSGYGMCTLLSQSEQALNPDTFDISGDTLYIGISNEDVINSFGGDITNLRSVLHFHNSNGNPHELIYTLETPIERALTATEITAFKAATTYNPNTMIQNSVDADMEVDYITKQYESAVKLMMAGNNSETQTPNYTSVLGITEKEEYKAASVSTLPYEFSNGDAVVYENEIHLMSTSANNTAHYKWNGEFWESVSTFPYSNYVNTKGAVVYKDAIHVMGNNYGDTNEAKYHYIWDGTSWTQSTNIPYYFCKGNAVVYKDYIHLLGSSYSTGGGATTYKKNHYKWNGSSWTSASTLPFELSEGGNAVVYEDAIHIMGGHGNGASKMHYKYNGTSWESASTLPYTFRSGNAVVQDDGIHILGNYSTDKRNHYKFKDGVWESMGELPYDFYLGRAVVYEKCIHMLGCSDFRSNHYRIGYMTSEYVKGYAKANSNIFIPTSSTPLTNNLTAIDDGYTVTADGYVEIEIL